VRDLEAVVEAAGLERFALMGLSQGGPVAIAYAAQHPERVSHLLLFGAYARGWLKRDLTDVQLAEERLLIDAMRIGWGRADPIFARVHSAQMIPEPSSEILRALDELARISATPENAAKLETEMHQIDVRHLAPQVQAPTLVLHPRYDRGVPFEEGRLLASLIPNAQFVPLESRNHVLLEDEPAWEKFVTAVQAFLAG
jgi:pimeloyl-ACP methyl ester carboxylesterase